VSFIELTLRGSGGITVNTAHIATFRTGIGGDLYRGNELVAHKGEVVTEIMLGGGVLPALAHIEVTEPYEKVRSLLRQSKEEEQA
jgi:hypothetical protein